MPNVKPRFSRRDLMIGSAALAGSLAMRGADLPVVPPQPGEDFNGYQQRRRRELWNLLGDLPWNHQPAPPRL
ncbi:MAG: hypothetical protein ABSF75_06505, partial [Terracidiphilus sp.]